jgi:glycosyltransferase involved in cell wall biosynthesis
MKNQCIRIGFLSSQNYLDRNTFSGILYYMHKALSRLEEIEVVNLGRPFTPSFIQKVAFKLAGLFGSGGDIDSNKFSSIVSKQLKKTPCDIIFAPVASHELQVCQVNCPVVYLSDVTFTLYHKCYGPYQGQTESEVHACAQAELKAIEKSRILVYPSEWAARSAMNDYGAAPEHVKVIPFGANIDNVPAIDWVLGQKQFSTCRLLFIGKEWDRKGGVVAYEALLSLLERGIDAELTIVGCIPPKGITHDRLRIIPFIDKNIPDQREALNLLFSQANFFILPTRADCSPIVICEAAAFALPTIASDVGGIPSLILEGENGYTLPISADGSDYADLIAKIFNQKSDYQKLFSKTREIYDTCLNWDSWAKSLKAVLVDSLRT